MSSTIKTTTCSIHSPTDDHSAIIADFRLTLPEELIVYTDQDLLRFLRGCNGDSKKAQAKLRSFHEWFHTPMQEPISALNGLHFSPNTLLYTPEHLANHPTGKGLLPVSHSGFDKDGRPLYWEKTGAVQANFSVVKKIFSKEELVQFHILSMLGLEMRYDFSARRCGHDVGSAIYISDMKGVNISLDVDSIWYMKQVIATDLAYFPERLHRMIIINSPWYFPTLYNLFKPFIDLRTREKIIILGSDYLPSLEQYMELSQIPEEYGGEDSEVDWESSSFRDSSGLSLVQIERRRGEMLGSDEYMLTAQEMTGLHQCFSHPKYRSKPDSCHLLGVLEQRMKQLGVELPCDEPPISPPLSIPPFVQGVGDGHAHSHEDVNDHSASEKDTLSHTSCTPATNLSRAVHNHDHNSLFAQPELQVRDLLTTRIVEAEHKGDHHVYVILVSFKNITSWTVRRRYSQFRVFMSKLARVVPSVQKDKYDDMPPKVLFNKMAEKVVNHRCSALNLFLKAAIDNCKSYGTKEQDAIFTFLNAYDNIIQHVCAGDAKGKEMLIRAGMASVEGGPGQALSEGEKRSVVGVADSTWQTSFAAAVIAAWVLMLSMGGEGFIS